jgi:hypothetical protein
MLCLMFFAPTRGVCATGDIPWGDLEIAAAIGGDIGTNRECILELVSKGVAVRNERGAIFSRRMVRDDQERQANTKRVRRHRVTANETVDVMPDVMPLSGTANATAILKKISEPHISEIYKLYPRKEARGAAFKAIASALQRLLRGEDSPGGLFHSLDDAVIYLCQRVKLFASSPAGQAGEFTPHPATWFNQKRYLDDESEWSRNGTNRQATQPTRQPSAQVARWNNNRAERERARAAVVGQAGTLAMDKRHDLAPGILLYWTEKLKSYSDAEICESLRLFSGEFFPSVDSIAQAIERKREAATAEATERRADITGRNLSATTATSRNSKPSTAARLRSRSGAKRTANS